MPEPKFPSEGIESTAFKRTNRKQFLKERPGLEYVSGDWGKNEKYRYKLPTGDYEYYDFTGYHTPGSTPQYVFQQGDAPKIMKAPVIGPTTSPVTPVAKAPVVVNPITNEQPQKSINFNSPYGYSDSNTGKTYSYDAGYKQKEIIPTVQNFKLGGLVKGYKWGGTTSTDKDGNEITTGIGSGQMDSAAQSGINIGSQLGSLGGSYLSSQAINEDGTIDAKQAALGGALSGGAKGAQMGMAFGPQGAAIGALAGAGIGAGMKYFGAKNINEDIAYGERNAEYDKARAEQASKFQTALNQQMQERQAGMKDGGVVKGKGTGTSDSIKAKVEAGSFVVPEKNAKVAEVVRKTVLKAPSAKKKANLNQSNGTEIKLSDGEHLFTPEEKQEIISELGEEFLEALAPNAEHEDENFRDGGLTPYKAKKMLADGTANGKPLTDKQRGYFGLIASGYKCGGMVKGYGNGGKVERGEGRSAFYSLPKDIKLNKQGANVDAYKSGFFPENYNPNIFHPQLTNEMVMDIANRPGAFRMNHLDELNKADRERILEMQNFLLKQGSERTDGHPGYLSKGYAEGGEVDGEDEINGTEPKLSARDEFAKILQQERDAAKTIADKKKLAEYEKILQRLEQGKSITKAQQKDIEAAGDVYERGKELDKQNIDNAKSAKIKKANTDLENNLTIYKRYSDEVKNYNPAKKGAYSLAELKTKQKEFLQKAIKAENELASYDVSPSNKESVVQKTVKSDIPYKDGEEIETITKSGNGIKKPYDKGSDFIGLGDLNKTIPLKTTASSRGVMKAPLVKNGLTVDQMKKLGPQIAETMNTKTDAPLNLASNKVNQGDVQLGKVDLSNQGVSDSGKGRGNVDWSLLGKGLQTGISQLGGLTNYFLPYQQYKMGQKYLAEAGERPKDQIDPDFQSAVNRAQVSAGYGYTPEELAIIKQQNINALRAGQEAAKNYSGGSGATALNITRQAAGDYYTRGLQALASGKNLQQSKQQYADSLIAAKADKSRQLFNDQMNAWQQSQVAGGNLVGMGLQNLIGARRLQQEQQFQDQMVANSNPYKNFGNNNLNVG